MKTNSINTQAEASAIMLAALQAMTTKQDPQNDLQEPAGESDGYEVYNMTSNLFPCVCVAMYETILSPTHFEENLNDGEDPYYYDTINFDDWRKLLTEKAQDYLDENVIETLKNYGLANIEACSIWSPKYYNYHNDELIMDVMMVAGWQEIMKEKIETWRGRQDVEKYIRENWHSYSGYFNLMPESLDEVLTERDEERQLAAYLTLALLVEGALKSCYEMMEELYYSIEDYSSGQRVNLLAEYMDDFEADRLLQLYSDDVAFNELYWDLAHKVGFIWLHEGPDYLRGKIDPDFEFYAKSDGERLLFWAVENGHTVRDLYAMAA